LSTVDTILQHYGVKGMKWGVRRRSGGFSLGRSKSKPEPSADKARAEAARAKLGKRGNADTLSNEELRLLINRMNQEQSLSRLLATQKSNTVSAFITKKVKDTATDEFTRFAQGKETKIIGTALALGAKGKHRKK
jgi:hypothetical protein